MAKYNIGIAGAAPIIGILVGLIAAQLMPVQARPQPASATSSFSHEGCQYPNRWSNPVDGCDNSDPAVPECIKAAYSQASERDCIDAYVKQYQAPQQPVEPVTTTPATETPTTNTCGGK